MVDANPASPKYQPVKTFTITTLGIGQNLIFEFREETVSDTGHKLQQ